MTILPLTEAAAVEGAGLGALTTERGNLPLDQIDIRAQVTGMTARTEVVQGFRNPFDVPLEATYVFPLPDRAAVTAMRMEAAGRTVEGVLKERAAARAEYDKAVREGRRASIAEEDRPDVFTMRVGNILPGERVMVRLALAGPLAYEDGEATFRFPLVVAPRYIPGEPLDGEPVGDGVAPDTDAVPDASRVTPPVLLPGFPNPVQLSIEVALDAAGLPLAGVRSSLHAVSTKDGVVRVQPGERVNRDFVLRLAYGDADAVTESLALVPDDDDAEGTFSLTVLPPTTAAPPRPRDLVLVLDRSGSMAGWKMVAARRAAARIVDTLTARDQFTVLSFDHVVERPTDLAGGLHEASDRNRFRAVEHLARLDARGGTELLAPLREAVGLLSEEGRERVLVLVTDGQVGNEDQIVRELTGPLRTVRVHTVGIDKAVNAGFLGRLAALGGGRCELVESEDRLDEAMDNIHRRIGAPVVTGVTIEGDLALVPDTLAPARLPDLFPGVPLRIAGRYRGRPGGALEVRGRTAAGEPWRARVAGARREAPAVVAEWARAHLRDLEDRYTAGSAGSPSVTEERIVATSLRFGVLCRFTAFVAVDSRVVTEGGQPHQVIQPVEIPEGWQLQPGPPGAQPDGLVAMAAGYTTATIRTMPAGPVPPRGRRTDSLAAARAQAAEEVRRLREAEAVGAPEHERRQLLDDLLTRLTALISHLAGTGTAADVLAPLRDLVEALKADGSDLDRLWQRAVDVLDAFGSPDATRGNRRSSFWKRG